MVHPRLVNAPLHQIGTEFLHLAFRPVSPRRRVPLCRRKPSTIAAVTTRIRGERRRSCDPDILGRRLDLNEGVVAS